MIPLKLIDDKANGDINLSGVQTNSKMIKELCLKNLYSYKFIYIIKNY